MTVQNGKYSARADHRRHDRLLITRFAMDDSYPGERDEASRLLATCADCAALAADVRVIAASMNQLRAPARPRDFTISQEQANSLRGSRLTQLLRGLATPGWATLRPAAGVAMSIGLVMAMVGSVVPGYAPAATGEGGTTGRDQLQTFSAPQGEAPAPRRTPAAAGAPVAPATPAAAGAPVAPATPAAAGGPVAPAASPVPAMEAPGYQQTDTSNGQQPEAQALPTQDASTRSLDMAYLEEASPEPAVSAADGDDAAALALLAPADPTRSILIYVGLAIAVVSLALLVVAWGARRYFADPLLR